MNHAIPTATVCPHCGGALGGPAPRAGAAPAGVAASNDPAIVFSANLVRYDLAALAVEAAEDKTYDESAKIRVTQQDIRKLLEKRRKGAK